MFWHSWHTTLLALSFLYLAGISQRRGKRPSANFSLGVSQGTFAVLGIMAGGIHRQWTTS